MRISELSRASGVSTRALRYYEEQGLLQPQRQSNRYRSYAPEDIEQVRRIRFMLAAGISTELARELLPCMVDDGDFLVPACQDLLSEFEREHALISAQIAELESVRRALAGIITATRASPRVASRR